MTRSTKILREEHAWVQSLLECLEALVDGYRVRGEFDAKAASELQSLLEGFVDGQHQEKEEAALFPKILERVRALQEDHARERAHLERMRFSLFDAMLGDEASRRRFVDEARRYLEVQRQHVRQEALGLLPLAEQLLTPKDDGEVLAEFERRDAEGLGRDRVHDRVRSLCRRLNVDFARSGEPVAAE